MACCKTRPKTFTRPPDGGWGWFVVAGSLVTRLLIYGNLSLAGVIISSLQSSMPSTSAVDIVLVTSIYFGLMFFVCPIGIYFNDRYGTRPVMIIGSALSTIGLFLSFFAFNIYHLCISYGVLTGIGHGFLIATNLVMLARYFEKQFALATGIACTGAGLGYFLFPPMTQIFVDNYGLYGAFLILSAINSHAFACALVMRPINITCQDQEKQNTDVSTDRCCKTIIKGLGFQLLCTNHNFALLMMAAFIVDISYLISLTLIIPHAIDTGVAALKASFLVTAMGIASLSTRLVQGWFVDKGYIRPIYLLPIVLLIMGAAQLSIALISIFPAMVVSCVLLGACDGIYIPALFVGMKDIVGATNYSRGNGIALLAMGIAGIIGTQAGGWIFDSTGSFQIIFYLAAICSLVSAVLFCATAARVRKQDAYAVETI
ncbi:monocarboxylate transporter 11-like [Saccoglossus kowalevskii]|uniref:Monocarboxylate transporter 11-like n=1 Tax=Saccoglossus kowalevskii TaxID=10224 RepID=A0ABM0M5A4_SACKO|nr:PREDICTED: monocarboxylate transporter 11-like [Saccoglossus kowalevskii]